MKKFLSLLTVLALVISLMPAAMAADAVAQIAGGDSYGSLGAAIAAAESGDTIVLLEDITLSEGVTVAADDVITLDLNGKVVRGVDTSASSSTLITNNGTLTIKDSTATTDGDGNYVSGKLTTQPVNHDTAEVPGYASNTISNNGVLTVESGIIENTEDGGACYAIDNYAGSSCTINGGVITTTKTAMRVYSWQGTGVEITLNITGGDIVSANGYGMTTQITAGDKFHLNISGGTITTGRADYPLAVYVNRTVADSTVNITGGTFNGQFAMNSQASESMVPGSVSISGGTFGGLSIYGTPAYGFITGGTFAVDPTDYVADGYKAVNVGTEEAPEYVVTIDRSSTPSNPPAPPADPSDPPVEGDDPEEGEEGGRIFEDIGEDHTFVNEIEWAYEEGYVKGVEEDTYDASASISRQQLWMVLSRHASIDPENMAEAKAWAMELGLSDGTAPGAAISRQQMVTILYRYAQLMGYDTSAKADLSAYPDAANVADYAADAMAWAVANGIINGTTAGTLNPAGNTTRGAFAAILYRFCNLPA